MKNIRGFAAFAAVACWAFATCPVMAQNLLTNGDFSAGNTGFTTSYTLSTMTPFLFQDNVHGIYAILPAADIAGSSVYGDWTNISKDPTGGNGKVFVADASTNANTNVWKETVSVTPDTNYVFRFYAAEVSNPDHSNAQFSSAIDGNTKTFSPVTGSWGSDVMTWNSGSNTSATITLVDLNTSGPYNDFALDDLSFTKASTSVPEPATFGLAVLGLGIAGVARRRRRTS